MTIIELLPGFMKYLEHERRYALNTCISYHRDLVDLAKHCPWSIHEITVKHLRSYQVVLSERRLTNATIQRKFACFTTFWRWLCLNGVVSVVLTDPITLPKVETHIRKWLNEGELKTFACTPAIGDSEIIALRNATAWMLLARLGLRRGEVLNLKISDVLIDSGWIVIRNPKNKHDRSLPIPRAVKGMLTDLIQDRTGYVFGLFGDEYHWSRNGFIRAFNAHVQQCGLGDKGITPHSIRHSFATLLLSKGVPVPVIQKILGHRDIKSTMIYVHLNDAQIRGAIHLLDDSDDDSDHDILADFHHIKAT